MIKLKSNETVEIVELSIYDVSPGLDQPRKEFNEKSIEKTYEKITKIKLGIHDEYEM